MKHLIVLLFACTGMARAWEIVPRRLCVWLDEDPSSNHCCALSSNSETLFQFEGIPGCNYSQDVFFRAQSVHPRGVEECNNQNCPNCESCNQSEFCGLTVMSAFGEGVASPGNFCYTLVSQTEIAMSSVDVMSLEPTPISSCLDLSCPRNAFCTVNTSKNQEIYCQCRDGYKKPTSDPAGPCIYCGARFHNCAPGHGCTSSKDKCECRTGFTGGDCNFVGDYEITTVTTTKNEVKHFKVGDGNVCSNLKPLSCLTDSADDTILAILCASSKPPSDALQVFETILECFQTYSEEDIGLYASGPLSFSATIGQVIDQVPALEDFASSNLRMAKLRYMVDVFATNGYNTGSHRIVALDSNIKHIDSFMSSRVPMSVNCMAVCPCDKVPARTYQRAYSCQATPIPRIELVMNSLRCGFVPSSTLHKIGVANPEYFASSAFHCLNELLLEGGTDDMKTVQESIPILEKLLNEVSSNGDNLVKLQALIDYVPTMHQTAATLAEPSTTFHAVPVLRNDTMLTKLNNSIRAVKDMFSDLSELEEHRKFTLTEHSMKQVLQTHFNRKRGNTEADMATTNAEILDTLAILETIVTRLEDVSFATNFTAADFRQTVFDFAETSYDLVSFAHQETVAIELKDIIKQTTVLMSTHIELLPILNSMLLNQLKLVHRAAHKCPTWWDDTSCTVELGTSEEVQQLSNLNAVAETIRSKVAKEQEELSELVSSSIWVAGAWNMDVYSFAEPIERLITTVTCAQMKIITQLDSLVLQGSSTSLVGTWYSECNLPEPTKPLEWENLYVEFKTNLVSAGFCRLPSTTDPKSNHRQLLNHRSLPIDTIPQQFSRSLQKKKDQEETRIMPFYATRESLKSLVDELLLPVLRGGTQPRDATEHELGLRDRYLSALDKVNMKCSQLLGKLRHVTESGKHQHEQLVQYQHHVLKQQQYFARMSNIHHFHFFNMTTYLDNAVEEYDGIEYVEMGDFLITLFLMALPQMHTISYFVQQQLNLPRSLIDLNRLYEICGAIVFADPGGQTLGNYCNNRSLVPAATSKSMAKLLQDLIHTRDNIIKLNGPTPIDEIVASSNEFENKLHLLEVTMEIDLKGAIENKFENRITFHLNGPGGKTPGPYFFASNVRATQLGLIFTDENGEPLGQELNKGGTSDGVEMLIDLQGTARKNVHETMYEFDLPQHQGIKFGYSIPDEKGTCLASHERLADKALCHQFSKLDMSPLPTPYRTWSVLITSGAELLKGAKRAFVLAALKGTVPDSNSAFVPFQHPPLVQPWKFAFDLDSSATTEGPQEPQPTDKVDGNTWMVPVIASAAATAAMVFTAMVVWHRRTKAKATSNPKFQLGLNGQANEV